MSAANWPIVIEEGSRYDFYVKKFDSECEPTSLDGWGAKMQIRKAKEATSPVLYEATVGDGIVLEEDGEVGLIHVGLPISVVNDPTEEWDKAFYDLLIWPPGGEAEDAKRLVEGTARWSPAVTR